MNNKATWYRRFYDFLVRKWFITAIIFSQTSLWFLILQFFGKQWGLIDKNGNLDATATTLSILFILFNFAFSIVKTFFDKENEKGKHHGQQILRKILDELNSENKVKLSRYSKGIDSYQEGQKIESCIDPYIQIEEILKSIQSAISSISDAAKTQIGLSLIIKTEQEWECISRLNLDDDLPIKEILSSPTSTIRKMIDTNRPYIFWPDKRDGFAVQEYLKSAFDETLPIMGSIYCKDISIKNDDRIILNAIISLTTYGTLICGSKDDSEIDRFVKTIMPEFELRLKIELCLLFMERFIGW
jgi:hypothetical protein